MKIELMCTTQTLLDGIANQELDKKDIALTYHLALLSSDETDWPKVNKAIIKRWSKSALIDIKALAWDGCFWEKEE